MEQFLTWEFAPPLRELETTLFVWSGFAIWIGIIARVPFRSRALRSPWLTFVLGFIGTCLGPFLTRSFFQLERFDPFGPAGIVSSVVTAALAITFFHVFSFLSPKDEYDDENYYYRREDRNAPYPRDVQVRGEYDPDEPLPPRRPTKRRQNYRED